MRRRDVLGVVLAGLLAGLVLEVLTALVARAGPQGAGWSFRHNGALVVPFGLGPAMLVGAWAALVRQAQGDAHWCAWGLGVLLVGVAVAVLSNAPLVLLGQTGPRLYGRLFLAPLAWLVIGPLLAGVFPVARRSPRWSEWYLVAGLLFPCALVIGFGVTAQVVVLR